MMIARRRLAWLLVGVAALGGCRRKAQEPEPILAFPTSSPAEAPPAPSPMPMVRSDWPMTVVDGFGRKVEIPRAPRRVVSLAPSNTELMFAVGAGDRLVGRTTVCSYPPAASAVPPVGGMTPKTINLEAVVALRPDLVLATCGVQEPLIAPLDRLGLKVVALDADDFDGVAKNIRTVGALADRPAEGDELARRFLGRVAAVRSRVAERTGPRPGVLYLVSGDPLMTAGPGTFIGRLIDAAGGRNVFGDVATRYPRPSEEEILARAPDVILTTRGAMNDGPADPAARRKLFAGRPGWAQVPAVRNGRITFLEEDEVSRPGPRLADGLEAMAAALEAPPAAPR